MALHQTSGRAALGAALASTTMLLWGALPIGLEAMLRHLDPSTVNWARFTVSALVLFAALALRGGLPRPGSFTRSTCALLAIAIIGLAANYAGYILGLSRSSPADAQVIIQLAPVLLSACGVLVFREPFTRWQWGGLGLLLVGLLAFAHGRFGTVGAPASLASGQALIVFAALVWVVYGLAQKQLLHTLPSPQIMLLLYAGCALAFTPVARFETIAALDGVGWALLAFCAGNTIVGYGAFAEALEHWEASRVGAVLALVPLVTLGLATALAPVWPDVVAAPTLSTSSWIGALLVVAGSLLAALATRKRGD